MASKLGPSTVRPAIGLAGSRDYQPLLAVLDLRVRMCPLYRYEVAGLIPGHPH